ncbi:MAG: hypothetical protein RLZZ607_216, partial [Pseudomonadota bacterium]
MPFLPFVLPALLWRKIKTTSFRQIFCRAGNCPMGITWQRLICALPPIG